MKNIVRPGTLAAFGFILGAASFVTLQINKENPIPWFVGLVGVLFLVVAFFWARGKGTLPRVLTEEDPYDE